MTKQQIKEKYGKYGELVNEFYKEWRDCRNGYLAIIETLSRKELSISWFLNNPISTYDCHIVMCVSFDYSSCYQAQRLWRKLKNKESRCEYIYKCIKNDIKERDCFISKSHDLNGCDFDCED
jgi:hypothetical protein